ncbi:MAG: arabinose isomerase, partial [Acidobacteria bacterium]|nr:arabinose isomerase [Acidobacteriota bacterium]
MKGQPKVGVFSVGFHRYWPQFAGLRERLEGYRERFEAGLREAGVEVVSAGLVDTVEAGRRAGERFAAESLDLVFCDVTTYVPSAYVLPVAQRSKAHLVLAGLQPTPGMDPAKATTPEQLAHDNCTSMPEIAYALKRAGLRCDVVFGMLEGDERAWMALREWCRAARAAHALKNARIGLLGHPFEGMLDMNADPTAFDAAFGMHVVMVEMCDFKKRVDEAGAGEVARMKSRIEEFFWFPDPGADAIAGRVTPEALEWSARVAVGLEKLVADFELEG